MSNRNVGDLNSFAFDKSQTWNNQVSGTDSLLTHSQSIFNAEDKQHMLIQQMEPLHSHLLLVSVMLNTVSHF